MKNLFLSLGEFIQKKKKLSISIAAILLLLIAGWIFFGPKQSAAQYQTAQVTKGTIISTVTESGNVASSNQANVGSPTTGIITALFVKDEDPVQAGQNLFQVKSTASQQEVASAWAAYQNAVSTANNVAQSKLSEQANLEKDRAAVIAASAAVTQMQNNIAASQPNPATKQAYTQSDIDSINSALTSAQETFTADQTKYTQADQSITAATASENSAWLAYQATQDSIVTSPVSGTVANLAYQVGDQVQASGNSVNTSSSNSNNTTNSSTNSVLSIGNFSAPYIKVQASEVDIPNIHQGEHAMITLSAYPSKTFVGTVNNVDTVGVVTSGVVSYNVYITFVAPPAGILPGMSATVTIETTRKDNVLSVPTSAIQTIGGQPEVRVMQNGKITFVPITTGIASTTDTEITSGLSEGQTIITNILQTTESSTTSPFNRGFGPGFGGGGTFRGVRGG